MDAEMSTRYPLEGKSAPFYSAPAPKCQSLKVNLLEFFVRSSLTPSIHRITGRLNSPPGRTALGSIAPSTRGVFQTGRLRRILTLGILVRIVLDTCARILSSGRSSRRRPFHLIACLSRNPVNVALR
ncbi:protein of unknown function [Candidatus Methylomirabilis oxygeniifera]|uniref:Uncharacterized protein n=1 Tax=Methylomirabilis oxygeniifera TaxID=671143 RepID=D5MJ63_METO1|nr:protein of unknown function [Candidatus Methylomirabilis oxyfera]